MDRAVVEELVRAAERLSDENFTFVGQEVRVSFKSSKEAWEVCLNFRRAAWRAAKELNKPIDMGR